jgi:transposase
VILSFPGSHRYFIYRSAADMRKGFDGLSGLVRGEFLLDPLSGDVFIFFNRPHNRIKILHWQGDGFAIYCKRLEKGTFELPKENSSSRSIEVSSEQLHFILQGIVLSSVKKRPRYEHTIVNKNSMVSGLSAVY